MDSYIKPYCFMLITLVLSTTSFHPSYASEGLDQSEGPGPSPSFDGFLPLAYKHVVIFNHISSGVTLTVHCRSEGKNLGVQQIPYGGSWDFHFHVNIWKTTVYRCSFAWPGNLKWFDIFKVSRDDTVVGQRYPVCRECIWSISGDIGPCRIRRDGKPPFCFNWDS